VEPVARCTSPSGRAFSLSERNSPLPFSSRYLSPSRCPYVRLRSGRTFDDFAYAGESSLDHYARRCSHTLDPSRELLLVIVCNRYWFSRPYTLYRRREYAFSLSLSLSLSLWPEIRVYAGATNYSYNLVCLITCTDIYIVMILRRFMIALRAYDPYVRMLPRWSLFVAIAVAASSPSRQWLIYASERTRNSFNELDFAWRTNSFLHLHSVLAVNHFSARVTRHDRGESRIRLIFTFYSFSNPASFYIRSAGRFTMRSCDRGIDIRNVVPIFTIDILGNNRRCKRVPLFQIENLGARLATVKNYVKSRSH